MSQLTSYDPGEIIFLEGESSKNMYLLEEGEVEVIKDDRVVSVIAERRSVFGEMAYLTGKKRTATLRAKTKVKAIPIEFKEGERFDTRLSAVSKSLLKMMAERLEASTRELTRLAPYEYFVMEAKKRANALPELKILIEELEKETFERKRQASDSLMSAYLMTPRVWARLKTALVEVLRTYVDDDFDMHGLENWTPNSSPLGDLSYVTFQGDREGLLMVDVDENLAHAISAGAQKDGGGAGEKADMNLSGLILNKLKSKSSEFEFEMGPPLTLASMEEAHQKLGNQPAIKMNIVSKTGKMRLIYQMA